MFSPDFMTWRAIYRYNVVLFPVANSLVAVRYNFHFMYGSSVGTNFQSRDEAYAFAARTSETLSLQSAPAPDATISTDATKPNGYVIVSLRLSPCLEFSMLVGCEEKDVLVHTFLQDTVLRL